jgi:hypothetical protein
MADALNPVIIGTAAEWLAWNETDWVKPEGGIRVSSADGKINPDAGKQKLMNAYNYFHGRRHDDEGKVSLHCLCFKESVHGRAK